MYKWGWEEKHLACLKCFAGCMSGLYSKQRRLLKAPVGVLLSILSGHNLQKRHNKYSSSLFLPCNWTEIDLSFPTVHLFSPHLTLMAQPLSTICSKACVLHGYNKKWVTSGYGTLIFQTSWLHKSFLMYDIETTED